MIFNTFLTTHYNVVFSRNKSFFFLCVLYVFVNNKASSDTDNDNSSCNKVQYVQFLVENVPIIKIVINRMVWTELTSSWQLQSAAVNGCYSNDMLPPIGLEYEFDTSYILHL